MTDLTNTIIPKSDQLNADSLISGPKTIKITKVSADTGSSEQPILVHYEGGEGAPWKPCKSMRRVLVTVWGANGAEYVGKSATLYRDPTVKWGGLEVGGIRISHMSDMDAPITLALTATKQSRKPYTVKPLIVDTKQADPVTEYGKTLFANLKSMTAKEIGEFWSETANMREGFPADRLAKMEKAVADRVEKGDE